MAGIGFELRRILQKKSVGAWLQAYGYAGLIGSGPWIFSVIAVLVIGIFSAVSAGNEAVSQFQVVVTYLMAGSLILTGGFQLLFTRFVADLFYIEANDEIIPNLNSLLAVISSISSAISVAVLLLFFEESIFLELLLCLNFVALCNLWILVIFVGCMKAYNQILVGFFVAYLSTAVIAIFLRDFGLSGFLMGLLVGHLFLSMFFLGMTYREFGFFYKMRFDWTSTQRMLPSLFCIGFLFNAAIWADKICFWLYDKAAVDIFPPLRTSLIYDFPIFMAYLTIIPGMAAFLVRMEADFSECCEHFYQAIRRGRTLDEIRQAKSLMVVSIRQGLSEVFKIQLLVYLIFLLWGKSIFEVLGISLLHLPLFYINMISVSFQVLLICVLNVLFYIDDRNSGLIICSFYLLTNALFTYITINQGLSFYGYGFLCASMVTFILGLVLLIRKLKRLEFDTFMLQ